MSALAIGGFVCDTEARRTNAEMRFLISALSNQAMATATAWALHAKTNSAVQLIHTIQP